MDKIKFGKTVRKFRKLRRLSQEAFGEALGVSANCVCLWETGKSAPTSERLIQIVNFLGIPKSVLGADLNKKEQELEFGPEQDLTPEDIALVFQIINHLKNRKR